MINIRDLFIFFRKLSDLELELKDKHETLVHLERREEKVFNWAIVSSVQMYSFLDC